MGDLRRIARKRAPRAVFDYADGAADDELGLRRSRAAFARVELIPRVLEDVSAIDTTTTILGRPSALPLAFAPTGFTRLFHHEGERAVARVAQRMGIPTGLSTVGTTTIEALAAEAPDIPKWFQLYLWPDRDASAALIRRAQAAGYAALALTVDTAVAGSRLRDVHNGLVFPPRPTLRTLGDMALHPSWWANVLTTEPLRFANIESPPTTVARVANLFEAALSPGVVTWLREVWNGPLVIKGSSPPTTPGGWSTSAPTRSWSPATARASSTARRRRSRSCRRSSRRSATARRSSWTRHPQRRRRGRRGGDGRRACLVARAYCYGLMAGGERGVQRAADLLQAEIVRTMALLGARAVSDLTPDRVRLRPPGA